MNAERPQVKEAITISRLTREFATTHTANLLGFSADQSWEDWTPEHLLVERGQKWRLSLVAQRHEGPVGYAILSCTDEATHHLHRLAVAASQRRSGIGRRLMETVMERARKEGAAVTLKVFRSNDGAIDFYSSLGFETLADTGDQLLMSSAPTR